MTLTVASWVDSRYCQDGPWRSRRAALPKPDRKSRVARRELTADRERSRDVGRVSLILAAGIDQNEIARTHFRSVLCVMQHAGVGA